MSARDGGVGLSRDAKAIVGSVVGSAIAILAALLTLVAPLRADLNGHEKLWAHPGTEKVIDQITKSNDELRAEIRLLRGEISALRREDRS